MIYVFSSRLDGGKKDRGNEGEDVALSIKVMAPVERLFAARSLDAPEAHLKTGLVIPVGRLMFTP